jgi:hypothetical protein
VVQDLGKMFRVWRDIGSLHPLYFTLDTLKNKLTSNNKMIL